MRGRTSKQGNCKGEGMEIDNNLDKLKEEPHLSGAYIRSLVKQLTSSRAKDHHPKNHLDSSLVINGDDGFSVHHQNLTTISDTPQPQQPPQQPQQHKKQVRRRLHTSRPYQERLLNMAEARREIVTALKLHRASMKQANDQNPTQTQSQPLQPSPQSDPEVKSKSRRNQRVYASTTATSNLSHNLDSFSYQSFPYQPPQNFYSWPMSASVPPPIPENFNFALPNQTLGLNLNLQDFNNLDASLFLNNCNPSSYSYSPSSPSSSSSPPLSVVTEETPLMAIQEEAPFVANPSLDNEEDLGLHHAINDEEMAEIRSLGEQHQIEWDDTLNMVTSAWWFKFLKNTEIGPEVKAEDDGCHPFDEVMEFPAWLNANDTCLLQLDDHCSIDYFQDPALPCMDIGEIEGMDGEWLA